MIFREAQIKDIPQIQNIRHVVRENKLSDPRLVTDADCANYLEKRGRGWVCEVRGEIVGFAIADLIGHNIWALFVHPDFEKQGIGRKLHDIMLDWYFTHTKITVWLGTAPNTRAEIFYRRAGWKDNGQNGKGEIKFEMEHEAWLALQ